METLERKCYETPSNSISLLSNCGGLEMHKPITRVCLRPACSPPLHYEWRTSHWTKCTARCGLNSRIRAVFCLNLSENRTVADTHCMHKEKPVAELPCLNVSCGYGWFVSNWSECSARCSAGLQRREVLCVRMTREGHVLLNVSSNKCEIAEKPPNEITCNNGECDADGGLLWQNGPWSKCSTSCAFGHQTRNVYCIDRTGMHHDISRCQKEFMPFKSQFCYTNCK